MATPFLTCSHGTVIALPAAGGMPQSVHIIDDDSIEAINAALATGRPLLVRGEPGTGKSQLARAAAVALGRAFLPYAVDARTETRDLLWTIDSVARLATAQVMSALHRVDHDEVMRRIDVREFVRPGPLWWAFDWASARDQARRAKASDPFTPEEWTAERGAVVLVDEIDKADAAIPNALLDALGHGRFEAPGPEVVAMHPERPPLVVITTNEERSMPDAFLRRCLVLHLGLPDRRDELIKTLMTRGQAHVKDCSENVLRKAAELLAEDRDALRKQDLMPPGLAEYIDLLRAVTGQRKGEKAQIDLLERIAKFALRKHPKEQPA